MEAQYFRDHNKEIKLKRIRGRNNTRSFGQSYDTPMQKQKCSTEEGNSNNSYFSKILFFCCPRNKQEIGANSRSNGRTVTASKNAGLKKCDVSNKTKKKETHEANPIFRDLYDFGCQHSLNSLSRSASQVTSVKLFSHSPEQKSQRNPLQVTFMTLAHKIKPKSKVPRPKPNKVVVVPVPDKFSDMSTPGPTASPAAMTASHSRPHQDKHSRRLIKDEPLRRYTDNVATRSHLGKICRPGEIYISHNLNRPM